MSKNKKKIDKSKNKYDTKIIFSEEHINNVIKEINKAHIFCKNSKYYKNDELIMCMILKHKLFPYKCCVRGCCVCDNWNDEPIYLIINRKNKKQSDLTLSNLELQCPNCYLQNYGLVKWQQKIKQVILYCSRCNYIINTLPDYNKMKKICITCDKKVKTHIKSSATSFTILEQCVDNSGESVNFDLNKDYKKRYIAYEKTINYDELDDILGEDSSHSNFRLNFNQNFNHNNYNFNHNHNNNHNFNNGANCASQLFEIDSDNQSNENEDVNNQNDRDEDDENNSSQTINRLSNLDFTNINENFNNKIDNSKFTSQLILDIENIANE